MNSVSEKVLRELEARVAACKGPCPSKIWSLIKFTATASYGFEQYRYH